MRIVLDVGCARYGGDYSIERLIEEFQPDELYGCDPNPVMDEMIAQYKEDPPLATDLHLAKAAAWTYNGTVGFREDGLNSWITDLQGAPQVECFDLAEMIRDKYGKTVYFETFADGRQGPPMVAVRDDAVTSTFVDTEEGRVWLEPPPEIILKLDCEGSEYDLLRHLIKTGADTMLKLAWIEWHAPDRGRELIEGEIACEIREWTW